MKRTCIFLTIKPFREVWIFTERSGWTVGLHTCILLLMQSWKGCIGRLYVPSLPPQPSNDNKSTNFVVVSKHNTVK